MLARSLWLTWILSHRTPIRFMRVPSLPFIDNSHENPAPASRRRESRANHAGRPPPTGARRPMDAGASVEWLADGPASNRRPGNGRCPTVGGAPHKRWEWRAFGASRTTAVNMADWV